MTDIVQRPGLAEVVRLPGHRIAVTGTMAQLSAVLVQLEDGGHLAALPRVPVPTGVSGQYIVTAKLQAHVIEASPRQRRSRTCWTAIAVGAVLMLAVGAWAAIAILTAVAAAAAAAVKALLGVLVVLGGIFLLLSVRGGGTWTGSGTWK